MDYGKYYLRMKEELLCVFLAVGLSALGAWLLYKSPFGMVLLLLLYPACRRYYREQKIAQQKKTLLLQFKDAMQSVSAALLSGYSMENAWKDAEREVGELYGENAYMTRELREMNVAIQMNQPMEQLLYQFALRSHCEDILSFAEVFRFAKRSGGNFGKIIGHTTARISEKLEIEREIMTVISGKKMEQKVMNVVPVGLLGYLNLTSGDFLAPLYGNFFGVCVMTGAFLAYLGALILSIRMIRIEW